MTDATNAGGDRLSIHADGRGWDEPLLERSAHPRGPAARRIVDSSGVARPAAALAGRAADLRHGRGPAGLARRPGLHAAPGWPRPPSAPAACSTSAPGADRAGRRPCGAAPGTFPIVALRRGGADTWGIEAIMLSAGTCVEWLRDDLGILADAADSADGGRRGATTPATSGSSPPCSASAPRCGTSGPGAPFTRADPGHGRPELVRAVLEGVAHRGADLLEAAEADSGLSRRRPAGRRGDVRQRRLRPGPGRRLRPTGRGLAGARGHHARVPRFLAGLAIGHLGRRGRRGRRLDRPGSEVEPARTDAERAAARARWLEARSRAEGAVPELSGIDF